MCEVCKCWGYSDFYDRQCPSLCYSQFLCVLEELDSCSMILGADLGLICASIIVSSLRTETNSASASYMYIGAQRMFGVELSYMQCKLLQEPSPQLKHSVLYVKCSFRLDHLFMFRMFASYSSVELIPTSLSCLYLSDSLISGRSEIVSIQYFN